MRSATFSDFDDFAESIRGVASKMMLQTPSRHHWAISSVELGGIDVQFGQLGSGNIAEGEVREGGTMLYLPITPRVDYSANGIVLDKDSFAVLDPGSEFCICTKAQHDWVAVTLPNHLLSSQGDDLVSVSANRPTVRATPADRQAANRFLDIVTNVMAASNIANEFESAPAALGASAELLKVAAQLLARSPHSKRRVGRPKVSREQIIARSRRNLEQREGEVVFVGDLAAAADVSERTLRSAFNEYFGVGPVRYLQYRQLHQVNRALRGADTDDTSVTKILAQHGVWEFSRFATRYRGHFGELPSETLQSN